MRRAEEFARRQRKKQAELVDYHNGSQLLPVLAVQAETRAKSDDGEIIADVRTVDFLIDASEMPWEPESGHTITRRDGRKFKVSAAGDEKCYRWHGRDGLTYRIHTIEVPAGEGA